MQIYYTYIIIELLFRQHPDSKYVVFRNGGRLCNSDSQRRNLRTSITVVWWRGCSMNCVGTGPTA